MKKVVLMSAAVFFLASSCKKNYTCECRNSGGTYTSGTVYASEKQAGKKCRDLSSGDTSCYAK